MIEVEIRFKTEKMDFETIKKKAIKNGSRKEKQIDIYYFPPHKDFLMNANGREYLRLRKDGDLKELTYKNAVYENGKFKRMIENTVDIDDFEALKLILEALGFREYIIVNKTRESFRQGGFEISFDEVESLGYFIEIERKGEIENIEEARQSCFEKAKEIGIRNLINCPKGYVQMLEDTANSKNKSEKKKAVIFILIDKDNNVLLEKKRNDHPNEPGAVLFTAGHVEDGETPEQSVFRELKEELGITDDNIYLKLINEMPEYKSLTGNSFHIFYYLVNGWDGKYEAKDIDGIVMANFDKSLINILDIKSDREIAKMLLGVS